MTLLLDKAGSTQTGFANLITISGDSGGIGMDDFPEDSSVFLITYDDVPGQLATADRLSTLVSTDWDKDIVVTAVNGGNDPYTGEDMTGNGHSYVDGDVIRVVYDVSQACGAGITLVDVDGNAISAPNPVILYHELSHAFHAAIDQLPFPQTECPGITSDEPAAEIDENVMRAQLGLCLRDVCNHDGSTGAGQTCGGSDGGPDGGPPAGGCEAGDDGCFVVSATTGSAWSSEVIALRLLRERVRGTSELAGRLIDAIYVEYASFSPPLAHALEQDDAARSLGLAFVVRPLLAWYALAGRLALDPDDTEGIQAATNAWREACPHPAIARELGAFVESLRNGGPCPATAPSWLEATAPHLQHACRLKLVGWAIVEPLLRSWATDGRDPQALVAGWLASAPLTVFPGAMATPRVLSELSLLFRFQPRAKLELGATLLSAWPKRAQVLIDQGFSKEEVNDGH